MLEWKQSSKWYVKLCKWLLSVAFHSSVVICQSCQPTEDWPFHIQASSYQKSYAKAHVYGLPLHLQDLLNVIFCRGFLPLERYLNHRHSVWCALKREVDAPIVLVSVWMGDSWFTICISASCHPQHPILILPSFNKIRL